MQIFFMLPLILIYVLFRSVVGTCVAIFTSQDCRGFPGCLRTVWQRTILWSHIIYIYVTAGASPADFSPSYNCSSVRCCVVDCRGFPGCSLSVIHI